MTPRQKALVLISVHQLRPQAQQAGEVFYARLFELDPRLRAMFPTDIRAQAAKLMAMLTMAAASLSNRDGFSAMARDLGHRHSGYGITAQHYQMMGDALIWTLEKCLGETFTAEVRESWQTAYTVLVAFMESVYAE